MVNVLVRPPAAPDRRVLQRMSFAPDRRDKVPGCAEVMATQKGNDLLPRSPLNLAHGIHKRVPVFLIIIRPMFAGFKVVGQRVKARVHFPSFLIALSKSAAFFRVIFMGSSTLPQ